MSGDTLKDVPPVNTRQVDGSTIKDRYKFGTVHTEDVPNDFSQKNVDIQIGKKNIRWQYEGKCPILITPSGVKAKQGAPRKEAQNQAYFALSILAEDGYVSRWEKK